MGLRDVRRWYCPSAFLVYVSLAFYVRLRQHTQPSTTSPKTPQIFTTLDPARLSTCDTIIRSYAEAAKGERSSRGGRWPTDEAERHSGRLLAGRGGKELNLRALLASLEAVLWSLAEGWDARAREFCVGEDAVHEGYCEAASG